MKMSEEKEKEEWTPSKKAGMRVVKTTIAGSLALLTSKIIGLFAPEFNSPETVVVLTSLYTALWTWWKNRKEEKKKDKEVKKE